MIKRFIIAIVLLAILAGGLIGFNLFRDKMIQDFFANMPVPTVTVSTVEAKESRWTPVIDAIGTVNALNGVDLTVETTGVVREIHFSANERVSAGDVLVQLDDSVQQADLASARAQASLDQESLQRASELSQRGVSSTVSLQAAEAAAANSAAQVAKLEAVLQQKQLRAPFAGTMGIPRVTEGQYLSPGASVVTLQDLDHMRVDFTVPEQRLGELNIGQAVRISLDGSDEVFEGRITGIDPKIDPSSRLVSVRAEIDNSDGLLVPGQFVRINVVLPEEDGIIALPQTAIVTSLYGDYVYIVREKEGSEDGVLEVRQSFISVGRRVGTQAEVRSGVAPGDRVVTAGQNRLSNGTPVAIDNTIDLNGENAPAGPGEAAAAEGTESP